MATVQAGTGLESPNGSGPFYPEVQNSYFKKSAPEIVDCWGRNGRLPPKNPRAQVGGEAPHMRPWVLRRKIAFSIPKIDDFRADFLKQNCLDLWAQQLAQTQHNDNVLGHAQPRPHYSRADPI